VACLDRELNYTEALDWFSLRFAEDSPAKAWQLVVRADASALQKSRLQNGLDSRVTARRRAA